MSKSVLGRGLSSLMGDQKPVGQDNPMAAPAAEDPAATPGVGSLFKGVRTDEKNVFAAPAEAAPAAPVLSEVKTEPEAQPALISPPAPVAVEASAPVSSAQPFRAQTAPAVKPVATPLPAKKSSVPYWYYFAGDVLLVTLVLLVVGRGSHPMSAGEVIFCVVAMVLAAALGVAGIYARNDTTE